MNINLKKIIAFDLDETLCTRNSDLVGLKSYESCVPLKENIEIANNFFDQGHKIIIYTARGMTLFKGDIIEINKNLGILTKTQLENWGVKYHELIFGKIEFDILIDDKAINTKDISKISF